MKAHGPGTPTTQLDPVGDVEWRKVAVDPPVLQLARSIPTPAALARDPEAWVAHQQNQPAAEAQRPPRGCKHCLEVIHVLNAQQKHRRLEGRGFQAWRAPETPCVPDQETPAPAVPAASQADEPLAGVHPGVVRSRRCGVRGQHSLSSPDIQERLARPQLQQFQDGGDREPAVVLTAALSHPSVVPLCYRVPTRPGAGASVPYSPSHLCLAFRGRYAGTGREPAAPAESSNPRTPERRDGLSSAAVSQAGVVIG